MAVDIVNALVGGGVSIGMESLVKLGIEIIRRGLEFGSTLERNKETLNSLAPLVDEIMRCNRGLETPIPGLEGLQDQLNHENKLVDKCSEPGRFKKFFLAPWNQKRLQASDEELQRRLAVQGQAQILTVVMKILEKVSNDNFGGIHNQMRPLGGAPVEPPEFKGMEGYLNILRAELLKENAPVVVLTGLPGSGKTMLARKICWDPQVKGRFGEKYIFFVTVSETFDVKNIVQKLFEDCGYPVSEFRTSPEDAISRLGSLLRYVHDGKNPILLVLDGVEHEQDAGLIRKFNFKIPGYKLLVTSRVALSRFGTPIRLEPLDHAAAVSMFRSFAGLDIAASSSDPEMHEKELHVNGIVEGCMGSPMLLYVASALLCGKSAADWATMKERLPVQRDYSKWLSCLQKIYDMLEDQFPNISQKECLMDLGLFPKDQRIPVPTLIDMWDELHHLDDDDGNRAMTILGDLDNRNLIKLIQRREELHYNSHFVEVPNHIRELAIRESKLEDFNQAKRLAIELNGDKPHEWWVGQNEAGIFGRIFQFLSNWWVVPSVAARVLSISTGTNFASDWPDMKADNAEVLVLNIRSSDYSLPQFMKEMRELRLLIVKKYGSGHCNLNGFMLLDSSPHLHRIRLENVAVPCFCRLNSLQKLSIRLCTWQAFENSSNRISAVMPNLVEMSIDYCKDLEKLPDGICDITPLKKLSITNCHKLSALPQDISKMVNLEVLRLRYCSALEVLPDRVEELRNLQCLDIYGCESLAKLPEHIGELQKLKNLYMNNCSGLSELPASIDNFGKLCHDLLVICDQERAHLWNRFFPNLSSNIKIIVSDEVPTLGWL